MTITNYIGTTDALAKIRALTEDPTAELVAFSWYMASDGGPLASVKYWDADDRCVAAWVCPDGESAFAVILGEKWDEFASDNDMLDEDYADEVWSTHYICDQDVYEIVDNPTAYGLTE